MMINALLTTIRCGDEHLFDITSDAVGTDKFSIPKYAVTLNTSAQTPYTSAPYELKRIACEAILHTVAITVAIEPATTDLRIT